MADLKEVKIDLEWKHFMKAMQDKMTQLLNNHQKVREQIERLEQSQAITTTNNINNTTQITPREVYRGRWYDDDDESIYESIQGCNKQDNNLGTVKMKIPNFHGISDLKAYLVWEKKVDFMFNCHNYSEEKKVKLVCMEFTDYASI